MPSKKSQGEGTQENGFNYGAVGGHSIRTGYNSPCATRPTWKIPKNERIVSDLQRCGGNVNMLLEAVDPEGDGRSRQILLGCILAQLKGDAEAYREWKSARAAGEEATLVLIEEAAIERARAGDTTLIKAILAKKKEDEGENEVERLRENMRGNSVRLPNVDGSGGGSTS